MFPKSSSPRLVKWLPHLTSNIVISETAEVQQLPVGSGTLREIRGLNTRAGLAVLQGDLSQYIKLLGKFSENHADDVESIVKATEAGNYDDAVHKAHTLKGVAATLGVERISTLASEIENLLKKKPQDDKLPELIETIRREMTDIIEALAIAFPPPVSSEELQVDNEVPDKSEAILILHQLEGLLEVSNTASNDLYEENKALLFKAYGEKAMLLGRQILEFSYPEAITTLRILLQR